MYNSETTSLSLLSISSTSDVVNALVSNKRIAGFVLCSFCVSTVLIVVFSVLIVVFSMLC